MTNEATDDTMMDSLVEAFLMHLETGDPAPELGHLPTRVRGEIEEIFGLLEAAWDSEIDLPPIEQDPVAIALGFVSPSGPEHTVLVDGPKVQSLRKQRHLDARQLMAAVTALGGALTLPELVRLERRSLNELSASDATALSDALGCPVRELSADPGHLDAFVAFLYSGAFDSAVAEWCAATGQEPIQMAVQARRRMLVGQRRSAGDGELADWLDILRAVLELLR